MPITDVKLGFVTHYDQDHVGGFTAFEDQSISFRSVYDQGPSMKRRGASVYSKYLDYVGDPDDDMLGDSDEEFVRKTAQVSRNWKIGEARVRVLSVRGDTRGSDNDVDLDPSAASIDENPGSIALLVSLGDFELYTAGDQTSNDWKTHEPDTEIAVVNAGAIGDDSDIDVYKANHHGSDTSNGRAFVQALSPEVAVVSSKYTKGHKLPKLVAIKQLADAGARIYVTGEGQGPAGLFTRSTVTTEDDIYSPPVSQVINRSGDVHILVRSDGERYRVFGGGRWCEYSAVDSEAGAPLACW
jgi:competence protein ComEC